MSLIYALILHLHMFFIYSGSQLTNTLISLRFDFPLTFFEINSKSSILGFFLCASPLAAIPPQRKTEIPCFSKSGATPVFCAYLRYLGWKLQCLGLEYLKALPHKAVSSTKHHSFNSIFL